MREITNINQNWKFFKENIGFEKAGLIFTSNEISAQDVDLPHTWNGRDGQDGGNDYYRGICYYAKKLGKIENDKNQLVYLEFKGVNSSSNVYLNNKLLATHHGGYSTFRVDITNYLNDQNILVVSADNLKNNTVYPQTADFTFYGGIYRDINLIKVNKSHFNLDFYGANGIKLTSKINDNCATLNVETYKVGGDSVKISVFDDKDNLIASSLDEKSIDINNVHLWNGLFDPYLYTVKAELIENNNVVDEINCKYGFRSFYVDAQKGFFLNGKSYPLRGVCRHQDRPLKGNALSKADHEEDIKLILEMGANTIRLAHYQHDQYFYDLCDKYGIVVWAEIPYISKHMPLANDNAVEQMKELIFQNFNHTSIVCWCLSNEITMHSANETRYECHEKLNELCHELDPDRFTVHACYMAITVRNKLSRVSDAVSFNLYYGWYLPFVGLTGWKLDNFHRLFPNNPVGLSEYGADAMPNIHSEHPKRGDNTEEYQLYYHENIIRIINERPYLWATHVWNMFDFAADARNQGGDPGMNHKGMITFDRKTKKDAFYLYKAFWSKEPFIHLCGKRFANRTGKKTKIKVYSNQNFVELYNNGKLIEKQEGNQIFNFTIDLQDTNQLTVKCGDLIDSATILKVAKPDKSYKLKKTKNKSWEK